MNVEILKTLESFSDYSISDGRKHLLQKLIDYIQLKIDNQDVIRLNFICTHNSRRSQFSQIWAQAMAFHFKVNNVICYSGGTEVTAMFPKVPEILIIQGFTIQKLNDSTNPIYAVKYDINAAPIVCFSKSYNDRFNPKTNYTAIMTCDDADTGCPFIIGVESKFIIRYSDPKIFDNTDQIDIKYKEKSLEIGQELWYVFSKLRQRAS